MSAADNRVAIRNKSTGEVGHGIRGHIPAGWEEYKGGNKASGEDAGNKVEGESVVRSGGRAPDHALPKRNLQTVYSPVGRGTVREPEGGRASGMGRAEVDRGKTERPS